MTNEEIVQEILEKHRSHVLDDIDDGHFTFTVQRENIWSDAVQAIKYFKEETQDIRVTFLTEDAVDGGGPRREFFTLLLKSMKNNNSLFDGPQTSRVLRHNTSALQDELFVIVGKFIVLSVLHGGPGPSFFSRSVVNYIFHGLPVYPGIDEIPSVDVQEVVLKIKSATDQEEFTKLISTSECSDLLTECGVTKPLATLDFNQKQSLIDSVCLHHVICNSLAELNQLKEGLGTLKFLSLIMEHQNYFKPLFLHQNDKISADFITEFFQVLYSPVGSNNRKKEEQLMMNWIFYLKALEVEPEPPLKLDEVFQFLTACNEVPPLGFPQDAKPIILFSEQHVFPVVSTCALSFTIPYSFPLQLEEFKESMNFSIIHLKDNFGHL
jgi:hypothetical protein